MRGQRQWRPRISMRSSVSVCCDCSRRHFIKKTATIPADHPIQRRLSHRKMQMRGIKRRWRRSSFLFSVFSTPPQRWSSSSKNSIEGKEHRRKREERLRSNDFVFARLNAHAECEQKGAFFEHFEKGKGEFGGFGAFPASSTSFTQIRLSSLKAGRRRSRRRWRHFFGCHPSSAPISTGAPAPLVSLLPSPSPLRPEPERRRCRHRRRRCRRREPSGRSLPWGKTSRDEKSLSHSIRNILFFWTQLTM